MGDTFQWHFQEANRVENNMAEIEIVFVSPDNTLILYSNNIAEDEAVIIGLS